MKLSKKGSTGGAEFAAWHPNFRNKTELPDIKTVRTKFFVNVVALLVAASAVLYYAYQEYTLRAIERQVAVIEAHIEKDSKPSADAIALYKKFREEEAKTKEAAAFVSSERLIFSEFLISAAKALPVDVSVVSVQYKDTSIAINGLAKGSPDLASSIASAYEKQLRESPDLKGRFKSITLTSLSRDAKTGYLNFSVTLEFTK